ncbi:hypothetical protein RQP46_007993 [Phenoliferia psychrophenolica]
MLPPLPHELTTDILKLATFSLVEQERHDSTITGQTNAFLLAASLVSHTWRNIAQPLLLKHGLVDPSRALHYIGELERQGLRDTLPAVRIGVPASRTVSDVDARAGGIGLRAILEELSLLRGLEFVGKRLRILAFAVKPNRVTNLSFTASNRGSFDRLLLALRHSFSPLEFTIIEDHSGDSNDPRPSYLEFGTFLPELGRLIQPLRSLCFTIESTEGGLYPSYMMSESLEAIRSVRLEFKDASTFEDIRSRANHMVFSSLSSLDSLDRLETHLDWIQDSAGWYGPGLEVLKILWDPTGAQYTSTITPEDRILSHISNLAALKELEVPDCWRSDAIEEACEAKGVELSWMPKCYSGN